jgi:hypothetical protein
MEGMTSDSVIPLEDVDSPRVELDTVDIPIEQSEQIEKNDQPTKQNRNLIIRLRNNPDTALVIVTFAFFVDYLLFLACVPILPLYGKELQLTDVQIGLLFSSRAIAQVCSSKIFNSITLFLISKIL